METEPQPKPPETAKKKFFRIDKKEMMYAAIIILLLYGVSYVGQIAAFDTINYINQTCPKLIDNVHVTPFGIIYNTTINTTPQNAPVIRSSAWSPFSNLTG